MTVVLNCRGDFTLENYRRVTLGLESVAIGEDARRTMDERHALFKRLLESNRDAFIYGVTARPGLQVKTAVSPEEQAAFATGSQFLGSGRGFSDRYLPERVVRGVVFARLTDFIEGHAKARAMVAERVAALLEKPLPPLPIEGQVAAGEILPMMHVTKDVDTSDFEEGEWMTLANGSPCSSALVADVALQARHRLGHAVIVSALSVEAMRAPLEAYDEALESLWIDEDECESLRALRHCLEGADESGRLRQQAPVSYRVLPRLLGQARRAVREVERAAATSLRAVGHNPVFVPPDAQHPLGRVISTGGYHNALGYPACNALARAWADLALLVERQTTALHIAEISELPQFLAPPDSPGASTNLFGWVAGGYVESARAAAQPTLLPATVNDARDDISSPAFLAYESEERAAAAFDGTLAILALVSSQALFVAGRQPAPPLRPFLEAVREMFPPVDGKRGRDYGTEAGSLRTLLKKGALSGEVLALVSPPGGRPGFS